MNKPASRLLEGFSAAAASRAIMGDIRPLLADIFSIMDEAAKEVGVDATVAAAGSPVGVEVWGRESLGMEWPPEVAAEIRPTVEGVSDMGILRGKKGLEAPASTLLESARAMGTLLGRAWDSRVEMRLAGGRAAVGLTLLLEDMVVVGVGSMCGAVEDCWVVGEALKLEFLLLMAE